MEPFRWRMALFWVGLSLTWNGSRAALAYVRPDTVFRWQWERFRKFWARLSKVSVNFNSRVSHCQKAGGISQMQRADAQNW
jgi:hypothetical protein